MYEKYPYLQSGTVAAVSGYTIWGISPLFFKLMQEIPTAEITAHRAIWSLIFVAIIILCQKKIKDLKSLRKNPKTIAGIAAAALMIAINWGVYVWAVNQKYTLETSLGYFTAPLISVLIGRLILKEKLSQKQQIAIAIATLAVIIKSLSVSGPIWISLSLAISFGIYGYIRKMNQIDPINGFFAEVFILAAIAIPFIITLEINGQGNFIKNDIQTQALFPATILFTAFPLILFAQAVKKLSLTIVGLLQYIVPSLTFVISIFILKEPIDLIGIIAFILIWCALVIFSIPKNNKQQKIKKATG